MREACVVRSPAKINLSLAVLGQREDGYHELDTTLLAIDRFDRVEVCRGPRPAGAGDEVRISLVGAAATADVPADASNLAVRAVEPVLALARERGLLGADTALELRLDKSIPSRAGLGGGSSNAAAACYGAARILGLDPDDETLASALANIGSDCPFFLLARRSGFARCTGHGELVEPLELPGTGRAFVVVTPDVACSTPEVYAAWRAGECGDPPAFDPEVWFRAPLADARAALRNDLEAAALRSHPDLLAFRNRLDDAGGTHFRLCGSGSSFFGLFEDSRAAEAFLEDLGVAGKARDHGLRHAFVARPATAAVGA